MIFRGRPGGVLWIEPELAETTTIAVSQVPAASVEAVRAGVEESSLADARRLRRQPAGPDRPDHRHHDDVDHHHRAGRPRGEPRATRRARSEPGLGATMSYRRNTELGLMVMVVIITAGAYVLASLGSEAPHPGQHHPVPRDRPGPAARGPRRGPAAGARVRPDPAADGRPAQRPRLRRHRRSEREAGRGPGQLDRRRHRRLRRHALLREAAPQPRALPLHVRPARHRAAAAAAGARPRARRSTAAASGSASATPASSPARSPRSSWPSSSPPTWSTSASCSPPASGRSGRCGCPTRSTSVR